MSTLDVSVNGLVFQVYGSNIPVLRSSPSRLRLGLEGCCSSCPGPGGTAIPSQAPASYGVQVVNQISGQGDSGSETALPPIPANILFPGFDPHFAHINSTEVNLHKLQSPSGPFGIPSSKTRNLNKSSEKTDGLRYL